MPVNHQMEMYSTQLDIYFRGKEKFSFRDFKSGQHTEVVFGTMEMEAILRETVE